MKIKFTTKLFGAIAGALLLSTSANAACGKITIADMNWSSASLMANVDKAMLEAMGCEVELVAGSTMPTFTSMNETGSPDVAPEIWANAFKDLVASATGAGRLHVANPEPMSGLGEGWWVLPSTLDANPELTSVEAILARPDLFPDKEDPSKGAFHGCPSGWSCQLINQSLFKAWDMEAKGWKLVDPGSNAGLDGSIAKAAESGGNWFGYYWNPTAIIGKYDMQQVEWGVPYAGDDNWHNCIALGADNCSDPEPSAWVNSVVIALVSDNMFYNGPKEAMGYFKARTWPGTVMNEMLVWMQDTGGTGADATVEFLTNHGDLWKTWVSADVAASVEASL
ncbi:ABC transporter substrate-binding protein [Candidatus Thioglobus sp.]|jgi:glycine betaine/proline transport system substrate-binding protein|nr:ABC transporter substrate-binding protein [Candidatus Thioglobus sp.]